VVNQIEWVLAQQIVYIENTQFSTEIAACLGNYSKLLTDYTSTWAQLAAFGLQPNEKATA
jgi:hypothetical protein